MIRLTSILALVLAATAVGTLPSLQAAEGTLSSPTATTLLADDAAFVQDALQGSLYEIKVSELALSRDPQGGERAFAQQVVDNHTEINRDLAELAKTRNIAVPTTLDATMQKQYDKLSNTPEKSFAEAYVDGQVAAHKKGLSAFEEASEDAKDPAVKALATKHLARIRTNLDQAKNLAEKY